MNSKVEAKRTLRYWLVKGVVLATIVLTIAVVATPNLLRSRVAANEASAVGSMRTINTALVTYRGEHPSEGYPPRLSDLAAYIDPVLASGQKSGYSFRYIAGSPDMDGAVRTFRLDAAPVSAQTGQRRFSSNESGQIRYQASLSEPARPLDAEPSQASQPASVAAARRMTQQSSLNLIVSKPSTVAEKIRALAYRVGGHVESVRSSNEGLENEATSIQIQVPVDRFEEARREVRALAERVQSEQDDARDVTAQHLDLESHLRNYRAEEAQYLEIMRRSGTIKDTLAVSERLADVRGRIERTQGQLDQLSHQTEMALLEVSLRTEIVTQPAEVHWRPAAEMKAAFRDAADDLSTYANFMIAVLFRMPVFALWMLTIVWSSIGTWRLLCWTWRRFASPLSRA